MVEVLQMGKVLLNQSDYLIGAEEIVCFFWCLPGLCLDQCETSWGNGFSVGEFSIA